MYATHPAQHEGTPSAPANEPGVADEPDVANPTIGGAQDDPDDGEAHEDDVDVGYEPL